MQSDSNVVGDTVDEAVSLFVTLDRQCHVQLLTEAASANGLQKTVIEKTDAEFSAKFIQDPHVGYLEVCMRALFFYHSFMLVSATVPTGI
jgi:hypothetical protein